MISKEVVIQNELGLHARAASLFVQLSSKYKADVFLQKDEKRINGKSIMGIMMLAAAKGTTLIISAEGEDAEIMVEKLNELIENKFGEE
ncbi:MAG: HPr family phosphocarrier protein [bacterium]